MHTCEDSWLHKRLSHRVREDEEDLWQRQVAGGIPGLVRDRREKLTTLTKEYVLCALMTLLKLPGDEKQDFWDRLIIERLCVQMYKGELKK